MIPATQRPDGTWRKERKIRTGFNSRSGGATRYVPPAFRNTAGGASSGDCETGDVLAFDHTRSLGDIDAADGKRLSRRFLKAALFLLTATPAPSTSTPAEGRQEHNEEETSQSSSRISSCRDADCPVKAFSFPLRSAAGAAKDLLGCGDCRQLSPEAGGLGGGSAAGDVASSSTNSKRGCGRMSDSTDTDDNSRNDRQRYKGMSLDDGSDGWWGRLRLAERGWPVSEAAQQGNPTAKEEREGEAWVGLELQLRTSDVCYTDGQFAIVDFLKGRVGHQTAALDEKQRGRLPPESKPSESAEVHLSGSPNVRAGETGEVPSDASNPERERRTPENGPEDGTAETVGADVSLVGGDHLRQTGEEATVLVAVLVFSSGLSKRDRAGLHGQAERAGGVASASHGVGEGRFLTLTCGLGGRAGAVELDLSPEEAELARCLFRLAQQEYHSRYECLSHREIREVVALGGPTIEAHPDLFRLLETKGQQQQQQHQTHTQHRRIDQPSNRKTSANKASGNDDGLVSEAPVEGNSSEQRDTITSSKQHRRQREHRRSSGGGSGGGGSFAAPLPSEANVIGEGGSHSIGGEKGEERTLAAQSGNEAAEPAFPLERCPW